MGFSQLWCVAIQADRQFQETTLYLVPSCTCCHKLVMFDMTLQKKKVFVYSSAALQRTVASLTDRQTDSLMPVFSLFFLPFFFLSSHYAFTISCYLQAHLCSPVLFACYFSLFLYGGYLSIYIMDQKFFTLHLYFFFFFSFFLFFIIIIIMWSKEVVFFLNKETVFMFSNLWNFKLGEWQVKMQNEANNILLTENKNVFVLSACLFSLHASSQLLYWLAPSLTWYETGVDRVCTYSNWSLPGWKLMIIVWCHN
jgi:hypothetical protein